VAPTTDDRVTGKRPATGGASRGGGAPSESVQDPSTGQGSASRAQAPKRRQMLQVVDDDEEEEEAALDLVHRSRRHSEVVPTPSV